MLQGSEQPQSAAEGQPDVVISEVVPPADAEAAEQVPPPVSAAVDEEEAG